MSLKARWYKWQEELIKKYLVYTKGKAYKYAFSYWPFIELYPGPSGSTYVHFRKRHLLDAPPFSSLIRPFNKVYILGSGPSVNTQDLTPLKQEAVITLNGSLVATCQAGLVPYAHIIIDANFILTRPDLVQLLPPKVPLLVSLSALKAMACFCPAQLHNRPVLLVRNPLGTFPQPLRCVQRLPQRHFVKSVDNPAYFSLTPDFGFADGGSVMTIGIQLAYYLGVQQVFLLGLDIGNAEQPRFYETKHNRQKCGLLKDYETKILPFMQLTRQVFEARGKEIYNCSPISKLPYEVIPYFHFPEKKR